MTDYQWSEDNDLKITNGDFVLGDATKQHQMVLLVAHQGSIKLNPEVGVGIDLMLVSDTSREILQRIRRHFRYDGMKVRGVQLNQGQLKIEAHYE